MAACPQIRGNVTDRAHRYRAVRNAPDGEKRCLFCGSTRNVEVGHLDGHEEHGEPENLVWTCRSCNVIAANSLRNARMGRATHQFNPKGGATTVGAWAQAVGAIVPKTGDPDRNEALRAGTKMTTAEGVAMIRATPTATRKRLAAQLAGHYGRKRNATRSNLFGFGSSSKKKSSVKRSSMTVSSASSAAYKAGQQSGDTGQFRTWAESKGLSDRGPWLQKSFDKGVNDGEGPPQRVTSQSDITKARASYSKMLAKAKEARTDAKQSGGYASIPSEAAIAKAYQDGAKNLTEALSMAGAKPNPSTVAGEQAAAQRFMAQAQAARLAGDLTRASSLERLARSRAAMAMVLKGERPNPADEALTAELKRRKADLVFGPNEEEERRKLRVWLEQQREMLTHRDWRKRMAANPQHRRRARRNSADASDLAYERFHGQPVGETVLVSDDLHEHEHLWTLGLLIEMRVDTMSGFECLLNFEDDPPYLCSSEDGKQLYIEAGDQKLDLKALKLDGAEWRKDRMVIGQLSPPGKDRSGKPVKWNLGYQTEKDFDKFETILYQHDLGEETGVRPFLEYEPRNEKLYISGGQYKIKLPLFGTSPGIEN
jgi:hypothetical protein